MKTLDEVIEGIRDQIGLGDPVLIDALHYLKEYKRYQNTPSRNGHIALVDYFEESQKNEPLIWDELKQMRGECVYVEGRTHKHWCIIKEFSKMDFICFVRTKQL